MTSPAERMKKLRERRSAGIRVMAVEVQIDTVEALIELDYLSVEDAHDLGEAAKALTRFIEDATSSVTSNAITLNAW
tara:strand:- start:6543 stop:6773 length:231 start_codon:yes stop_codon:yes gene_type:complete